MQSSTTDYSSQIRPALTSFADEVSATVARLFAYVGVLALFGILAVQAWEQLQIEWVEEPRQESGWSVAERASPAIALSRQGTSDKADGSETYVVFRHPSGGRKDVLRWSGSDGPLAELEIYRPGGEYDSPAAARAELADRMPTPGSKREGVELESAGAVESKFGTVALLRQAGIGADAPSCVGFLKRIDDPALQISGWSCQGDSLSARSDGIACMLNRLMSLAPGNEPKLAQLFARAELPPGSCPSMKVPSDWITSAGAPNLRGSL